MIKTIVLVEDDSAVSDSMVMALEAEGYKVETYATGDRLLSGDFAIPELFILDKQLPGVNGLDLCKYLKQRKDTAGIPVIVLSASSAAKNPALLSGAAGFLEKPFGREELTELIRKLSGSN